VGEIIFEFYGGDPPPPLCNYIGNITGIAPRQSDRIGTPVGTIIGLPPRYVVFTSTSGRRRTTLQPERMRMADGSLFPIRPHLPVLLFPHSLATTPVESAGRTDTLMSFLGSPRFSGHIVRLGLEHSSPFEESGFWKDHRSTLSTRLTDDSVEFEAAIWQRSSERSGAAICSLSDCWLVLWFDTDLLGDFRDSSCTSDDIMLIVRRNLGDSTAGIERFQLEEHEGNFIPTPIDQVIRGFVPPFNPEYSPLTFRWRMARHDIGLVERQGYPVMCGFAAEVVCMPTAGAADCSSLAFELAYPPNFNRTDPRTWGTLIVANRKDTTYTSNH